MIETKRWNIQKETSHQLEYIKEAAALLRNGSTVAFPTETVYGLGADATSEAAVAKIFQAKGRPQDNPLIAHVATKQQLMQLVKDLPPYVDKLIDSFSPGPITYVLPSNGIIASNVTAGLSTVAVRMPDHPLAQQLLAVCDRPIAAPSANISGKPSPTTAEHVWHDLSGKIAGLIDGGPTGVGLESTVLDCTQDIPIILRPGGITQEQLEQVIGHVAVDPALANSHERPKSPGMKYKHYSPEVPLWIVEGTVSRLQQLISDQGEQGKRVGVIASSDKAAKLVADEVIDLGQTIETIATNLYDALRTFKADNIDLIVCESFPEDGIGQAVMNRLRKAASENIRK